MDSALQPSQHRIPMTITLVLLAAFFGKGAEMGWSQTLDEIRSSPVTSPHGRVSEVHYDTGLIELPSGFLAHSPAGSERRFRFPEPVWILGYATSIYDATGEVPRENYLCHTFLGDRPFTQSHEPRMTAIYSDSFTREVRLPEGFALFVDGGQELHWLPLFNNREAASARVGMKMTVTLIRQSDIIRLPKRLYSTLHSAQMPHLFFVPPKRHQQEAVIRLGIRGRIHFMGTHVHPHAEFVELHNLSRGERVWKGVSKSDDSGEMTGFEVYSSGEGYPVSPGEIYRLISAYDNPTGREIDAMAGLFVMYSLAPE